MREHSVWLHVAVQGGWGAEGPEYEGVTRVYAPRFFVSSQQKFGRTDTEAPSAGHSSQRTDRVTALK